MLGHGDPAVLAAVGGASLRPDAVYLLAYRDALQARGHGSLMPEISQPTSATPIRRPSARGDRPRSARRRERILTGAACRSGCSWTSMRWIRRRFPRRRADRRRARLGRT
jgi:hypothetical protein